MKQYTTTYRLWWNFCLEKNISVFGPANRDIMTFLQYTSEKYNYKYGAINSNRSALNLILINDIGSDPLIKRFMKGMARLRPAQPKYGSTWDPEVLLSYIEQLPEDLDLNLLSHKLITLLTLVTGERLQTLSLIRLTNILENEQEIQINITDPIKTSGLNRVQPTLYLPFFKERPKLCPALTLKKYIDATKVFRKKEHDFVFLTIKRPHSVASKQTLSKWVKKMLELAGIDISQFKPHSTRHSSSSAALRQGISIETIRRTVGWSEGSSVFAKFYNRPLSDRTAYAKAILSNSDKA